MSSPLEHYAKYRTIEVYSSYQRLGRMNTTELTIHLPAEEVAYLKAYAKAHGLSVTQVIDRYLRRMRLLDNHNPLPELDTITGLVPSDVDVEAETIRHLQDKHSR